MGPADGSEHNIRVQVAVGVAPREVRVVCLSLPVGSTLRDALRQALGDSRLQGQVADLSEDTLASGRWSVGVWGRKERAGHVLRDRDRVEVVRGLTVDPKEARRVRYRAQGDAFPRVIGRPKPVVPRSPG